MLPALPPRIIILWLALEHPRRARAIAENCRLEQENLV
jgi:hypothetical protein